jgi:hypothetical protein
MPERPHIYFLTEGTPIPSSWYVVAAGIHMTTYAKSESLNLRRDPRCSLLRPGWLPGAAEC